MSQLSRRKSNNRSNVEGDSRPFVEGPLSFKHFFRAGRFLFP